jgi:transcriptional regulator with XRE-family HTH domain
MNSAIKPPELSAFYRSLHARGLTIAQLAEFVDRSVPTVTRVLNGARRRGPLWLKLAPHLTAKELALLHVAQSSTWNTPRLLARPTWPPQISPAQR